MTFNWDIEGHIASPGKVHFNGKCRSIYIPYIDPMAMPPCNLAAISRMLLEETIPNITLYCILRFAKGGWKNTPNGWARRFSSSGLHSSGSAGCWSGTTVQSDCENVEFLHW